MSMAFSAADLSRPIMEEAMSGTGITMQKKLSDAVAEALPAPGKERSSWITHYSPITVVFGASNRRESFLIIDRVSLLLFLLPGAGCCACGGDRPLGNYQELRIPLHSITSVSAEASNDEDFTITAVLHAAANNWLKWRNPQQSLERSITIHSTRRTEVLRALKSMLNVLYYGEPTATRRVQWKNVPAAVEAVGEIVPEEYLEQRANGCFEAKFLAHVYGALTADHGHDSPACWSATSPPFLHVYRRFFRPEYKCKEYIPRAPVGLYEQTALNDVEPIVHNVLWSDWLAHARMQQGCAPYRLPGFVQSCTSSLLSDVPVDTVRIFDLHGSEYMRSSNTSDRPIERLPRIDSNPTDGEPGYACTADGSVVAGGIRWFNPALRCDARLVADPQIVQAALQAIAHNNSVRTLSFDRMCLTSHTAALTALDFCAVICRVNTTLTSMAFPYIKVGNGLALEPADAAKYTEAWKKIGDALVANPNPRFMSLDFSGGNMGDAGLAALAPGLLRLFAPTKGALRPVSLRFNDNQLSAAGVLNLCNTVLSVADLSQLQVFALGGNPWTDVTQANSVGAVVDVVKKCPALKVLDVNAQYRHFPATSALHAAVVASGCPLEEFAAGGAPVIPREAEEWIAGVVALVKSKSATLRKVNLPGIQLTALQVAQMAALLPAVEVDLSDGAISGAYPGTAFEMDPKLMARTLNLAKNTYFVLQMWRSFPRLLVELDLSDAQQVGGSAQVFDRLVDSFRTLTESIALQGLSVARLPVHGNAALHQSFKILLQVLLMSEFIRLRRLDITGCQSGLLGLSTLGACLRVNRSLRSLKFDGQAAQDVFELADGWKALRGCFYGNKKIVDLSYPWCDVVFYFQSVANAVKMGMVAAQVVKQDIGHAHRSSQWSLKNQKIQEIIAVKKTFKTRERARIGSVRTLHNIFEAVRLNSLQAAAAQASKQADKRADPKAQEVREKLAAKMHVQLTKVRDLLVKVSEKQPAGSNLGFWMEIAGSLASGPLLFAPERLCVFASLLESVAGAANVKVRRCVQDMDKVTVQMVKKAADYGRTDKEFAQDIAQSVPGLFDFFRHLNFADSLGRGLTKKEGKSGRKEKKDDEEDDAADGDAAYVAEPEERQSDDPILVQMPDEVTHSDDGAYQAVDMYGDPVDSVPVPTGTGSNGDTTRAHGGASQGQYTALSSGLPIVSLSAKPFPGAQPFVAQAHKQWNDALVNAISQSADKLVQPLDYKTQTRFLSTRATPAKVAGTCTLVTQCSVDRLGRLEQQARAWGGRLSAAVYISTASPTVKSEALAEVRALVQRLDSQSSYSGQLVISVLFGHEDSPWLWDGAGTDSLDGPLYPINALRNLAAAVAETPLLFLVDVDFVPSAGLNEWVQNASDSQGLVQRCQHGELVVVPAFERMTVAEGQEPTASLTVGSVCAGLEDGSITAFHVKHFPAGHFPTNYSQWQEASTASAPTPDPVLGTYPVQYREYYEPYVVVAKERFVPYDERFRGYGMNKCVHLRALAERGCTFHVLVGHFLVADCHAKSEAHQRTYGSESGYRKHVVAAAYRAAVRDIQAGAQPAVSMSTARLIRRAGKEARERASSAKCLKKELRVAARRMMQRGKEVLVTLTTGPAAQASI